MTWIAQFVTTTTAQRYVAGTVANINTYIEDFGVNIDPNEASASGKVMLFLRQPTSGLNTRVGSTDAVLTLGKLHTVVWQFKNASTQRLAVDGEEKAITINSQTYTSNTDGANDFAFTLMNRNVRGSFTKGGSGFKVSFFARIPSGNLDIERLSADPFSLLGRRQLLPVLAAGAGGPPTLASILGVSTGPGEATITVY